MLRQALSNQVSCSQGDGDCKHDGLRDAGSGGVNRNVNPGLLGKSRDPGRSDPG